MSCPGYCQQPQRGSPLRRGLAPRLKGGWRNYRSASLTRPRAGACLFWAGILLPARGGVKDYFGICAIAEQVKIQAYTLLQPDAVRGLCLYCLLKLNGGALCASCESWVTFRKKGRRVQRGYLCIRNAIQIPCRSESRIPGIPWADRLCAVIYKSWGSRRMNSCSCWPIASRTSFSLLR